MADVHELEPSTLFGQDAARVPHARLWLGLILLVALGLRLQLLGGPWSGLALDFHSHFGAWAVGEPAERFATEGFAATGWMPVNWSVELADGTVVRDVYAHHPALFTILVGLSLKLFGLHEWAVRLVPLLFSMLAIFGTWRLVSRWFGERAGLVAAALLATVPYLTWYGMLAWTEGALIWIGAAELGAYARWLDTRRARFVLEAAAWQLLAGLFDWSGAFLMLGIALHALVFRVRKLGLRACLPLLALPAAFTVAVLVHAMHMRLVMPASERAADTSGTLATVTTLTTSVSFWLGAQVRFAWRFLGSVAFILVGYGLVRVLPRLARRKLGERDALILVALLPGLMYIGLFPQRSINHDFFLMLSLPGLALLAAAGLEPLLAIVPRARRLKAFGLTLLAVAAVGFARTEQVAAARHSDQMPKIAAALEKRLFGIVEKLRPGRPAYFLFDVVTEAQLASSTAADLLGNPAPDQLAERFATFVQTAPREDVTATLSSLQVGSLAPLYDFLTQRFPSHFVTVGSVGIFEVFDLRDER